MTNKNVIPFPGAIPAPKTEAVRDYAKRMGVPYIDMAGGILANDPPPPSPPFADPLRTLAEALAGAFIESRYAMLRKAFEAHRPGIAAALAVTVLDYLPPDERENFTAFVRRIAHE